MAVNFAKSHMNVKRFPDLIALLAPLDHSNMGDVVDRKGPPGAALCDNVHQWPPIFAQNR